MRHVSRVNYIATRNHVRRIERLDDLSQHIWRFHPHTGHDRDTVAGLGDDAQLPSAEDMITQRSQRFRSWSVIQSIHDHVTANIK